MRRLTALLASAALAVVLLSGTHGEDGAYTAEAQTAAKPNIVFILADDMRKDDLKYMPKTRSLLGDEGMTFQNAFVTNALCCPSRVTIMRGQYSHNTHVWTNSADSNGGWEAYQANGLENDNMATRLHNAGYRTALLGKYLNEYSGTFVPIGWDRWFAWQRAHGGGYFDYNINSNGTIRHFGTSEDDYLTDVLSDKTRTFIDTSVSLNKPFFAYVAPFAPHNPATPAPRHAHTYDGEEASRPPSFNEPIVSDKPPWISSLPPLTTDQIAQIDNLHQRRAESLQALDDLVGGVIAKLTNEGVMSNTYVVFTSDNGWHEGEHRVQNGKWRPYEEDIRMPLLVRGPSVQAGTTASELALNTDYLPTFTNLAGIRKPGYADGRSLRPVLEGNIAAWRSAILLEAAASNHSPAYRGILTSGDRKYVEYAGGARELYSISADPYELDNNYDAAAPPTFLASRLGTLRTCRPEAKDTTNTTIPCYAAEDGP